MTDSALDPDTALDPGVVARLVRDHEGLFPVVAQQYDSGEVLTVGWMDDEALRRTTTMGRVTYRRRGEAGYWTPGEPSGTEQWVKSVALQCTGEAVLVQVDVVGSACHTGQRTCFDDGTLRPLAGQE